MKLMKTQRKLILNFSENVSEFVSINDGELFNIFFLLSTDSKLQSLKDENKSIKEFSNLLSNYFTLESTDYKDSLDLDFSEQLNVIEYIKLGSTNSIFIKLNQYL